MATRISPPQNKTYYINPAYLTFVENSGYGANLIQVSASSSCSISVYDPANGIGYSDADRNYRRWKVTAYNNKFPDDVAAHRGKWYIYVRLEQNGSSALVIYDQVLRGVKGGEVTVSKDENGNDVYTEAETTQTDYFYIRIGEVGETDGASIREITYDTGYLTSDEGRDTADLNDMWELDKYSTPWLIRAKQWLTNFTVKGFITLIGGLVFKNNDNEKVVSDIKRSTDSDNEYLLDENGEPVTNEDGSKVKNPDYVPVSDETIPTTKYLETVTKDKFLRKDQDDRTPFSLAVGGKTTAEGGIQIGKEFAAGWTGFGGNIDERGQAELESLVLRRFLEVPELRFNRQTVRMGDSITSVSAGIVQSVSPETEDEGTLVLKLEEGEFGTLAADDIVVQIFSDMTNSENNADESTDDGKGNRFTKGFATVMFRVIEVSGEKNETIRYRLRPVSDSWPKQVHPFAMGPFGQRGNFTDTERQTLIYEGICPKPYTRYMKNVNDWEFTSDMIGMQIGYLGNLSVFGMDMSGYSAYVDNIFYKGFIFELTEQQKAEISAYDVSLTSYVGTVRVDSEGNIHAGEYTPVNVVTGEENVVSGDENVVTGEYLLQTRVQVHKGQDELAFVDGTPGDKQFTSVISTNGCTAGIANGVISITSVENTDYCSVKVETLCEGKATYYSTYQVKVIKDGSSALYADIDNEMDSVACDESGKVLFGLPVSCNVSAWYGQRQLEIKEIALSSPEGVTATAVVDEEGVYTGKVEVTGITTEAADSLQIGIAVSVELFDKTETRNLTFTVNKVKQGESAVLYKLRPSVDSVKVDNENKLSVDSVSCLVLKVNAKGAEELKELPEWLSLQYSVDGGDFEASGSYPAEAGVTKDTQRVTFRLYQDDVLIDAETVPVVKDGNAIKEVGEYYLANNDKDTVPSYEDEGWQTDIPEISKEARYLWNYEIISYTGKEPTRTTPVIIAMWTEDGKGVKEVFEWYQVNNDKDTVPAYPHEEGDAWVRDTAPSMREDARFLWNYEEIVWTDDTVTYTAPAVIGAMGETGATTPVLSVSHAAISRNSLGTFDPRYITVTSTRGTAREEVWMTMYGLTEDGSLIVVEDNTAYISQWSIDLQEYSESFEKLECKSLVFRSYLEETTDYNAPYLADTGLTFVQDGEVGEHGPMPRNRGKYDGSTPYYYNDEYRDYVWTPAGEVFIRKVRGGTYPDGSEKGSVTGFQPTSDEDNTYWEMADRMALTAIDTALIDEANIAGFIFKKDKMVSQDWSLDENNEPDATIILDGVNGYFKCTDADVRGSITAGMMSYRVLLGGGDLTGYSMAYGAGTFYLPLVDEYQTMEIKAYINATTSSEIDSVYRMFMSVKKDDGGYVEDRLLVYNEDTGYAYKETSVGIKPNTLYTFSGYNDGYDTYWLISEGTGGSGIGSVTIVDKEMDENSMNPVVNSTIYKKFESLGPFTYNEESGYWKFNGDMLVTGGVTMYGNDSSFTPSTIMDAVAVDGTTIMNDGAKLYLNPNLDLGGGASSWDELEGKPSWIGSAKPEYTFAEIKTKPTTIAGYGITDAKIANGVITLGSNTITPLTSHQTIYGLTVKDSSGTTQISYTPATSGTYSLTLTKAMVGLGNVENTALSTWGGSTSVKTVGTITSGTWNGSKIANAYLANSSMTINGSSVSLGGSLDLYIGKTKAQTSSAVQSLTGIGNVIPDANNTYTLGTSSSMQWKNVYTKESYIDGIRLYKSQSGVLFLEGNLVVSGGVTMFGTDSVTASTVMDGVQVDGKTISKANGYLEVIGGVGGGGLDSVTVTGTGNAVTAASLSNNVLTLTKGDTFLTQTTGDARYVTALGTNGNYLTWTKNGTANNITVPFATNADKLDGVHSTGFYRTHGGAIKSTDINTYVARNSGSYAVHVYNGNSVAYSGLLSVLGGYDSNVGTNGGSVTNIELYASHYTLNKTYPLQVRLSIDNVSYTAWKSLAFTDSDITGNAATASMASQVYINNSTSNDVFPLVFTNTKTCGTAQKDSLYVRSTKGSGYNPSTDTFVATTFSGNATTATSLSGTTPQLAAASESNEIKVVNNAYDAITTNKPQAGASITKAIQFRWYDDYWQIGAIRGSSTPSIGWGVTLGSSNLRLRVTSTGVVVYGTLKADSFSGIPTRNVNINGEGWTVYSPYTTNTTGIYAPTDGGTSGYVLKANGSTSVPTWVAQSSLSVGDSVKFSGISMRHDYNFASGAMDANIMYTIDTTALSTSYFYPVVFHSTGKDLYVRMFSTQASSTYAYNQNKLEFTFRGQGWNDTPQGLTVHYYGCFDAAEKTIGCIGMGTEQGDKVVWVRGGLYYYMVSNITPSLKTSSYTSGNEIYTVGTNLYGGTNTKVTVYWTPQVTSGLGTLYHSSHFTAAGAVSVGANFSVGGTSTFTGAVTAKDNVTAGNMLQIGSSGTYARMRLFCENSSYYATGGAVFLQAGNYAGTATSGTLILSGINVGDLTLCKVCGPLHVTGKVSTDSSYFVKGTSGAGNGYSLYNESLPTQYGVFMGTTANFSTHGGVTGGWATYFCMNGFNEVRGWIFRNSYNNTNVASINTSGNMLVNGGITMYSDIRKKTKLRDVELTLDEVADAPLIEHYYKADERKTTHVGSIAQYWAGLNDWFCKKDDEGFYTMEIQNAALASSISVARQLRRFESETDRRIRALEEENRLLRDEIEQLKKA